MSEEKPKKPITLLQQLEMTRFDHALEVANSLAQNRALLTTMELERMNKVLIGKNAGDHTNPWREEPVTLVLPSGKQETLSIISDPKLTTREHLHVATELAENGHVIDAVVSIYVQLVLSHVFKDANRRTAVLAAHYFLTRYDVPLSGLALHEIGLGDLREPGQIESLKETVAQMVKFAQKRGK